MLSIKRPRFSLGFFLGFSALFHMSHAQSSFIDIGGGNQPQMEQAVSLAKSSESVAADAAVRTLRIGGFGEQIDTYTGGLSFSHTDISLPGNSHLEVAVRRSISQATKYHPHQSAGFGDWELEVPRIYRKVVQTVKYNGSGWTSTETEGAIVTQFGREAPSWSTARCSRPDVVGPYYQLPNRWTSANGGRSIRPNWNSYKIVPEWFYNEETYSDGTHLAIPGQGTQEILDTPNGALWNGAPKKVTKNHWKFECISNIAGGGEGFIAIAPNGDRWRFDKLVYRQAPYIRAFPKGMGQVRIYSITGASYAMLLASEVTDVNGNWVKYVYTNDGKLKRIHSNDLRNIELDYQSNKGRDVSTVTANGKTWQYDYLAGNAVRPATLEQVTLPNGRSWTFGLDNLYYEALTGKACKLPNFYVSLTHPSGAKAQFELSETVRVAPSKLSGQNLNSRCQYDPTTSGWAYKSGWNRVFETVSVVKKTITGPSLPMNTWRYAYNGTKVSVTGPAQTRTDYKFHASSAGEGQPSEVSVFDANVLKRKTTYRYAFGPVMGKTFRAYHHSNSYDGDNKASLLMEVNIEQGGDTYRTLNTYNTNVNSSTYSYGNPIKVTSTSSVSSGSRVKDYTYSDNKTKWVLGLMSNTKQNGVSTTSFIYDSLGRPTKESRFGRTHATFGYHPPAKEMYKGKLHWVQNNLEQRTYFLDWKRGTAKHKKRPDGLSSYKEVDDNGLITKETDFLRECTNYKYDGIGRLTDILPCDLRWAKTQIGYNYTSTAEVSHGTAGMLKQTTTTGNLQKVVYYDGLQRPVMAKIWDSSKPATATYQRTSYDSLGQVSYQSLPHDTASTPYGNNMTYDGLGRTLIIDNNTTAGALSYRYLSGNRTVVNDNKGNVTTTTYQAYGAPSNDQATRIVSPHNTITQMAYNVFGNTTSISQGGKTETRVYDSYQQLCKTVRPDVGNTAYAYDGAGRQAWSAKGSSVSGSTTTCDNSVHYADKATFVLNNLGQTTNVNYNDSSPDIAYVYDANGRVTRMTAGSVTTVMAYNSAGLLEKETMNVDGENFALDYVYNRNRNLINTIYPSGANIAYAPNALGQATRSGNYATAANYFANGSMKSHSYGNGFTHTATQYASGLPKTFYDRKSSTYAISHGFTYDANNNVTFLDDKVSNAYDLRFTFDGLNRLDKITDSYLGTGDVNYDTLGNITYYKLGNRAIAYHYNSKKQLASTSGSKAYNFVYDDKGNVTDNGSRAFEYNTANQMMKSGGYTYTYDANNKRVKQDDSKGISYSLYGSNGKLMYRNVNNQHIDYYYLGGKLVAKNKGDTITYMHSDYLGSTAAESNEVGSSIDRMHYQPFGESIEEPKDDIGYTGHKFDTDLGLSYMQARYYDPVIGRFYSNDPVGYTAKNPVMSFNRYMYVNNNPYKYTDPNGEFLANIIGAVVGAGIDAAIQYASTGEVNLAQVGVAAVAGATGVGLANYARNAAKAWGAAGSAANITSQAATNVVGGAAIGAESSLVNDAIKGTDAATSLSNAKTAAAFGSVGQVVGIGASKLADKLISGVQSLGGINNVSPAGEAISEAFADGIGATVSGAPAIAEAYTKED